MICVVGQVEAVPPENCFYCAVEPIGHDGDAVSEPSTEMSEGWEGRIDVDASDELVHFHLAGPHQVDLAHHAFARADAAGFPVLFNVAPGWSGKAFQQEVRRVEGCNRPVEINKQAALHTRTRHYLGTR